MKTQRTSALNLQAATELPATTQQAITGINDFSFRLLAQLATTKSDKNLLISGLSIATAFALVGHGATGKTREEILQTFGWADLSAQAIAEAFGALASVYHKNDPSLVLAMANSLWQAEHDPINPRYVEDVQQLYRADIFAINFNSPDAAETINQWVAEKTLQKIKQLVTSNDISGATLALLNAIYFKASWQKTFDLRRTQDRPFTLLDGSTKSLPLMRQKARFSYCEQEHFQAIALPYADERYCMAIVLPRSTITFAEFQQRFDNSDWQMIREEFHNTEVDLALPRFNIVEPIMLNAPLQMLGVKKAFAANAEFPLISSSLYISKVLHKAALTVNEEGAEAAAATIILMTRGALSRPTEMTVDHPFLCLIYDAEHGTILFAGYIVDPE